MVDAMSDSGTDDVWRLCKQHALVDDTVHLHAGHDRRVELRSPVVCNKPTRHVFTADKSINVVVLADDERK